MITKIQCFNFETQLKFSKKFGLSGGTPLCQLYRYVPPQREWFLSRFALKTGIDFDVPLCIWSEIGYGFQGNHASV